MRMPALLATIAAALFAAAPAVAQSTDTEQAAPPMSQDDSEAVQKVINQAKEAVADDSAAVNAIRNDPDASGQDYNRAAMLYRAAKSLLRDSDYSAATDSAGNAADAIARAAQGVHDNFDRQDQAVGAPPMRDSSVDNTQQANPDGVPARTFRDSTVFGVQPDQPDGVPQRMPPEESMPDNTEKPQPVDQP
jgi:hypothetical protein